MHWMEFSTMDCLDPVVALKTDAIIGKTLLFASFENIYHPIRDITFSLPR